MRCPFAVLLIFSFFSSTAQDNSYVIPRFDIRAGIGNTLLGSGDFKTRVFEFEINYKLNPYFTSAVGLMLGNSNKGERGGANFTQGNLNIFVSPWRNNRRNDFRIGSGVSLYSINDFYLAGERFTQSGVRIRDYIFNERKSIGANIIIENTYAVSPRILLGVKVLTQPYLNSDINTGFVVKAGVRI